MKYKKIKELPQGVYKIHYENGQIEFSFLWKSKFGDTLIFPICNESFVDELDKKFAKTIIGIQSVSYITKNVGSHNAT